MQLSSIVATALLPLLALAETSTTTSTMTMTKYITISKVSTSSIYSANSTTSYYLPTGTGSIASVSSTFVVPTTTTGADGSPTVVAPTVSPTINNSAAGLGSAHVALAGLVGVVVAALM
ncbi:hypothetical protein GGR54DRAFT_312490 [Hypoxylon sp. NC1633]|nr:hypothetical protein GGR54DRAFT_312490 [Hypoxylon sp. NC1633]